MRRLTALQSPVFLVNSRLGLFAAAAPGSRGKRVHPGRHPFSRGYGVILPSSLTMVLPIALVCSTHPPVSVCGTGTSRLPRGFSRERGLTRFAKEASSRTSALAGGDLRYPPAYVRSRGRPEPRRATLLRHPVGDVAAPVVQECRPAVRRLRLPASP